MMNNQLGTEIAHHPVAVFPFPVSCFWYLPDVFALIKQPLICPAFWGEEP
ncbi:hypothetical protein CAY60_009235 [Shouchella clausii]|uniref:Uncharacterized protein n=1 Tax=Shouchella rhizosphaerae TaxID=866786 RepID=A0ABZ2CXZ9_9BACI|nr:MULTISPECIES: hypothetical protein [Shouchella]MCM3313725.1 hypothetical protein [Psychrobacillus sp. MER TA 17]ALA54263.1 hypothetical protein DB29_03435 [Shouchella clausii]MBU3232622.1 hypothetical protein [Shouchella clausii]MBU3266295.1 hypothetical protein [Shouchella clausii]MBU3506122.1 hypothetical protein [Shouchella clausii]